MKPTPIISGNWKMNKTINEATELARSLKQTLSNEQIEIVVFPPFLAVPAVAKELANSNIAVGTQNVNANEKGAFTGEISPQMAKDAGCKWVLIGHSERRTVGRAKNDAELAKAFEEALARGLTPIETNSTVNKKVLASLAAGLKVTMCIGETAYERDAKLTEEIVGAQVREGLAGLAGGQIPNLVIAYEPRWAIGEGKTPPAPEDAQKVHAHIRKILGQMFGEKIGSAVRIQYGGNANPGNISGFMAQQDINGALVGGSSLKPESFSAIVRGAK